MDAGLKRKLAGVSVATLSTALFKIGLRNQVLQDVRPVAPKGRNMVGPACTLRLIPAREDRNGIEALAKPDHPQRVAVEQCPPGHVLVIDSRRDPGAASAGDLLIMRLQVRGVAGVVTDGGFRDSPRIGSLDIPAYQNRPSPPTSLILHEAIAINDPIGCGEVAVFPRDIVVGDDEAAVVIPAGAAEAIADEAVAMTAFEDFVAEELRRGAAIIGLYPATDPAVQDRFADWRKRNGR